MSLNENTLGRSIAKVFEKTARKEVGNSGAIDADINLVFPSRANPRRIIDDAELEGLVQSIRQHGIIQPLVVLRKDGGYEIVAGERRYRAAVKAGLTTVPVIIRNDSSPEALAEIRLIENIQREDLNPIDVAKAYQELITQFGMTQESVAEKVGKDRSSVANSVRLLTLSEAVQQQVVAGALSMGHARTLCGLVDQQAQNELCTRIIAENLNVREVESLVARLQSEAGQRPKGGRKEKPPHLRELEGNLKRLFDCPVTVREKNGKGALTIHFESRNAFKEIVDLLDQAFRAKAAQPPAEGDGNGVE